MLMVRLYHRCFPVSRATGKTKAET
jgi:hypothetical protein